MARFVIPVPDGTAARSQWVQRTIIAGREYLLSFRWNTREERWYLSIADQDGVAIVSGLKIVCNWPLTRLVTDPRAPEADLIAIDMSGDGIDPGLLDLGVRVLLTLTTAD